ncbi:MAG: actin-bundling T4SS effector WalE1 family protein [Wolbachia sp.]
MDDQQSVKKDQLINQLKQQIDFCDKLDAKKLQNLLAKDNNNLYEIFSEHRDEFKKVIRECKTEHTHFNTLESFNKAAKGIKQVL